MDAMSPNERMQGYVHRQERNRRSQYDGRSHQAGAPTSLTGRSDGCSRIRGTGGIVAIDGCGLCSAPMR